MLIQLYGIYCTSEIPSKMSFSTSTCRRGIWLSDWISVAGISGHTLTDGDMKKGRNNNFGAFVLTARQSFKDRLTMC